MHSNMTQGELITNSQLSEFIWEMLSSMSQGKIMHSSITQSESMTISQLIISETHFGISKGKNSATRALGPKGHRIFYIYRKHS